MRLKKVFQKGLVVALSVMFALAAAELFLRISGIWVGRHSDTMFTLMAFDDQLGWKMRANAEESVSFVDVEYIPVRGNSSGFWDKELKLEKEPQRSRVAFLGDSFTWGLGVRAEQRFTNILESNNPHYEALNFGIPGWGTDQSLLAWQSIVSRYRPDVVVMTVYQNDYVDNMFAVRYGRRKPYFEWQPGGTLQMKSIGGDSRDFWKDGVYNEAAPPYATLFPHPVEHRSRLMHWLVKYSDVARLAYTTLRHSNETGEHATSANSATGPRLIAELGPSEQVGVGLMSELLKEFAAEVNASGTKFIVLLAGHPISNFDVQARELKEAGIQYLKVTTDVLAAKLGEDNKHVYFPYNKHWTPDAHRVVAMLVEQNLVALAPRNEKKEKLSAHASAPAKSAAKNR